jgi:O-antigen/teichoic acid export membrane protein
MSLMGFGSMGLAWSVVVGIVISVAATAFLRPRDFPVLPGFRGIRAVFRFSKFASLIYIIAEMAKGAPELIIGRSSGVVQVGLFSRANGIPELLQRGILRPVLMVCMPYFAAHDRERGSLAPAYASTVGLLTSVGWPFFAVMSVLSYAAIRIIYGEQWIEAAPVAQTLCLAGAIGLLFLPSREALLACGEGRRASALQAQLAILQVAGLLFAIPFGLSGAAWGLVGAAIGGVVVSQWHMRRIGVTSWSLLRACVPSAVLTLVTAGPLAVAASIWPVAEPNHVIWALAGLSGALMLWLAGLFALRHVLWTEITRFVQRLRAQMTAGRR